MSDFSPKIKNSVIATLGFFSLFGRALNASEIVQYFYVDGEDTEYLDLCKKNQAGVENAITEVLENGDLFEQKEGYFFLKKEAARYSRDSETIKDAQEKLLKKCRRYLPMLTWIPYIRMVAIGNTLAFGAADNESDIDLFIIIEEKHLWISRLFITIFFHMLGVRRHGNKITSRFCLSFYADTSVLDFEKIKIDVTDIYLRFWAVTLKPFFGKNAYFSFIHENEKSLMNSFPFWNPDMQMREVHERSDNLRKFQFLQEGFWSSNLGYKIADWFTKLQRKKMEALPVPQTEASSVIVSDHMLKFHNNDRRKEYQEEWTKIITN